MATIPRPTPSGARLLAGLALLVVMGLAGAGVASAQADDPAAAFLEAVSEASDTTQAGIDESIAAIDTGCMGLAIEDCLREIVAVQLPDVVAEYAAYADHLEGLSPPETLADDVDLHVETLRDASVLLQEVVAAAESGQTSPITGVVDRLIAAHTDLARHLDAAYGHAAFVSPFVGLPNTPFQAIDFEVVMGASEAEEAYLQDVRGTTALLGEREACFGRAFGPFDADAELIERLSGCGIGTTLDAMVEQARLLEPPARFVDAHAWWLATLEAQAEHDRSAGEAIDASDLSGVIAGQVRIGLANRPYPGLDPTFGSASQLPGSRLGSAPDPEAPVASSEFGQALFDALVAYWVVDPRFHAMLPFELPGIPEEDALAAVGAVASDLRAAEGDLRSALAGLEPPPELAADHELMLDYFQRARDRLDAYLEAAEAGDAARAMAAMEDGFADYCATVAGLSEEVRPVTDVFFAGLGCG